LWPGEFFLYIYDPTFSVSLLVSFAIFVHFLYGPLNDIKHALLVHVPICLALLIQTHT
jgi:hypothetical protein